MTKAWYHTDWQYDWYFMSVNVSKVGQLGDNI